jgi:N-acetyl-alpha-D-muramate 1-phosphate uridylyltransferase
MKTAMILAAGRGERLRPLTDTTPKALMNVQGIPLIEHHVIKLAQANFERIVINHAYLGGQIRQHLGNGARFGVDILYSPEPPGGLETGGGLANAKELLGKKPFLTVNADVFTDYDFATLRLPSNRLAHFVLVNKPDYLDKGDFGISSNELLNNEQRDLTFSGIACYHPAVVQHLTLGRYSIIPTVRHYAAKGQIAASLYTGHWIDIGTIERLQRLEF